MLERRKKERKEPSAESQVCSTLRRLDETGSLKIGRTSLSLALGNMVVARQILLILNLSYLPCSVQFVNKNYCHAKNDLFTTC